MQNMQLLANPKKIQAFLNDLKDSNHISIDIEFMRRNTYFPEPCVMQISNGKIHSCIDLALEIDYKELLCELFFSNKLIIFHSCRQDLEIIYMLFGKIPKNIFDTQIAASFLGYKFQIGYAELMKEIFNIEINKSEKMTNWKKRPLTNNQIQYALNDVIHLNDLYHFLNKQLVETKKIDYFQEEIKNFIEDVDWEPQIENSWKRIRSIKSLDKITKKIAKAIATWREKKAIELNIPRNWILAEKSIIELSIEFKNTKKVSLPNNKYIDKIKDFERIKITINEIENNDKYQSFENINVNNLKEYKKIADDLYNYYKSVSIKNNISYQVVSPKKMIRNYLREKDSKSRLVSGWRRKLIDIDKVSNITDSYFDLG